MRKQTKLAVVLAAAALLAVTSASVVSASGWVQEGAEWRYQDSSGDYVTDTMKKSGETTFYLDENGYMAKDYFLENGNNDNKYYFGSNGAMVKNTWVAIDPALVNDDNGRDVCWFYFQETGKAFKANNDVAKKKIDGKTYFFNADGIMMTGWFDSTGTQLDNDDSTEFITTTGTEAVYYCGEDGVARAGWLAYTGGVDEDYYFGDDQSGNLADRATLYFYFNTSNFKRERDKDKTINGKKYHFADNGVMMSGWDYLENKNSEKKLASTSLFKYYSGEDDGHLVKKGWVYAVPSDIISTTKHQDDEKEYFYFDNSGIMTMETQKKINGKYYVFGDNGIMKTGLVLLGRGNQYVDKVDLDYTDASDFIKKNVYYNGDPNGEDGDDKGPYVLNIKAAANYTPTIGGVTALPGKTDKQGNNVMSIHYYGSDGARVTGNNINVEFANDNKQFASKNSGGFQGKENKKWYSNGFLLKASDDLKLGLVIASDTLARRPYSKTEINTGNDPQDGTVNAEIKVVSTAGSEKKKGAYKDGDGNYWLVNAKGKFVGIFDLQVRIKNNNYEWKTTKTINNETKEDQWIKFTETNASQGSISEHIVDINDDYCLNFYLQ